MAAEGPVLAASRLCANRCRSTRRLSRKTSLTAKAPGDVITAYRRSELMANALLKCRTPRHQAKTQAIIQHRKAPTHRDNHPPIDACRALTVDQRSMNNARLGFYCLGYGVEIALPQRRQQIRRQLQAVAIALREAMLDQETYALT